MELSKYEFLQELHYTSQEPNYGQLPKSTTAAVPASIQSSAKAVLLASRLQMLQKLQMSRLFPRIWLARRRRDDKVCVMLQDVSSEQSLIEDDV